jgi:hypothetical protein
MKIIILSFLGLFTTLSFGQYHDKYDPYQQSDYPAEKYQITYDTIRFSSFLIGIRQIRNKSGYEPFTCRAWLTITDKDKLIYQRYFRDIDAVGDCHGIFIPLSQPRDDYFILSKLGDYDGRIFIIDIKGNVTEKIGGEFYISKDKQYLFSSYHSDLSGFTVFDFKNGQTLFSDTITPRIIDWYYKDNKYFTSIELSNGQISNIDYYFFDFATKKLILSKLNREYLKPEDKLTAYNGNTTRRFCNCGFEIHQSKK